MDSRDVCTIQRQLCNPEYCGSYHPVSNQEKSQQSTTRMKQTKFILVINIMRRWQQISQYACMYMVRALHALLRVVITDHNHLPQDYFVATG